MMRITTIPLTKPFFGEEERKAIVQPLEDGWVSQGTKTREFEKAFAEFIGVQYALATSSCTAALHLSLIALGISSGDEIIVPAFTYVATANAVEYVGAKPIFVDIDPYTFNIDPGQIEAKLTSQTKGIIPVHLFGLSAPMNSIWEIKQKYQLRIIEDAACAHGAKYRDQKVGGLGNLGCFSFHPRKIITTGEGGMITTNSQPLWELMAKLRSHGESVSDLTRHLQGETHLPHFDILGYNYRMTDLQSIIGIEQLKKLDWIIKERVLRANIYNEHLTDIPWLQLPIIPPGHTHVFQAYVISLKGNAPISRDGLMRRLLEKGIATRPGTHAVHTLGYYTQKYGWKAEDCPVAWWADSHTLTLPLFPSLSQDEQMFVIQNLRNINE